MPVPMMWLSQAVFIYWAQTVWSSLPADVNVEQACQTGAGTLNPACTPLV